MQILVSFGEALVDRFIALFELDGFSAKFVRGMPRNWPVDERPAHADAFSRALCQTRGALPDLLDFHASFIRGWKSETGAAQVRTDTE